MRGLQITAVSNWRSTGLVDDTGAAEATVLAVSTESVIRRRIEPGRTEGEEKRGGESGGTGEHGW
jgi:hypothetical protein